MRNKINSTNKKTLLLIACLMIVATTIGIYLLLQQRREYVIESAQSPQYKTMLPSGKTIQQLGGWNRVSPPNTTPVYSYNDTLEGVQIGVTQQPLPEAFKREPELQTSKLAERDNATIKFNAGNTTVYMGNSARGPQSLYLTKNGLLVLVKSQRKISENAWITYIQALQ